MSNAGGDWSTRYATKEPIINHSFGLSTLWYLWVLARPIRNFDTRNWGLSGVVWELRKRNGNLSVTAEQYHWYRRESDLSPRMATTLGRCERWHELQLYLLPR